MKTARIMLCHIS